MSFNISSRRKEKNRYEIYQQGSNSQTEIILNMSEEDDKNEAEKGENIK